jgi:hypothetical protein
MSNNHIQDPNRNNSHKNLHISGRAIYEVCKRWRKNLSIAWIDYQKAFDSVPYNQTERLVGVKSTIATFCKPLLETWNTMLQLKSKQQAVLSKPIMLYTKIFQGDSWSPNLHIIRSYKGLG